MEPLDISEDWAKRRAKSGERRGEGEENIKNNVQACNLKSSAQKVSQHRLRDLNLEAQIVQNASQGSLGDPLDAPWTALGSLRGSVGRSGGSWDALWCSSGALWELCGGLPELSGTMLEAFWDDFRALFLSLARSVVVCLGRPSCLVFGPPSFVLCCLTFVERIPCNSNHGGSASRLSRLERGRSLPFLVIYLMLIMNFVDMFVPQTVLALGVLT